MSRIAGMLSRALAVTAGLAAFCAAGADALPGNAIAAGPVAAEFRGCDASGWCRFRIAALESSPGQLHRVRPEGVPIAADEEALARQVRDRLNALMSSMIHQHKRVVLHGLRTLAEGRMAARITVNESDVAEDPVLLELGRRLSADAR